MSESEIVLPARHPWALLGGAVLFLGTGIASLGGLQLSCTRGGTGGGTCMFAETALASGAREVVPLDAVDHTEAERIHSPKAKLPLTRFVLVMKDGRRLPSWSETSSTDKRPLVTAYAQFQSETAPSFTKTVSGYGVFSWASILFGAVWALAALYVAPLRRAVRVDPSERIVRIRTRGWGGWHDLAVLPLHAGLHVSEVVIDKTRHLALEGPETELATVITELDGGLQKSNIRTRIDELIADGVRSMDAREQDDDDGDRDGTNLSPSPSRLERHLDPHPIAVSQEQRVRLPELLRARWLSPTPSRL